MKMKCQKYLKVQNTMYICMSSKGWEWELDKRGEMDKEFWEHRDFEWERFPERSIREEKENIQNHELNKIITTLHDGVVVVVVELSWANADSAGRIQKQKCKDTSSGLSPQAPTNLKAKMVHIDECDATVRLR